MREPPADLPAASLHAPLRDAYGLDVAEITYLPLGHDTSAWVYRVRTPAGGDYFLKARKRPVSAAGLLVPRVLHDQGIEHVIAPLPTGTGSLSTGLADYTLVLYPFVEGVSGKAGACRRRSGSSTARSCGGFTRRPCRPTSPRSCRAKRSSRPAPRWFAIWMPTSIKPSPSVPGRRGSPPSGASTGRQFTGFSLPRSNWRRWLRDRICPACSATPISIPRTCWPAPTAGSGLSTGMRRYWRRKNGT